MSKERAGKHYAGRYMGEDVVFIPLTRGLTAIVDAHVFPQIADEYGTLWSACDNGRGHINARREKPTDKGMRAVTLARAVMNPTETEEVRARNGAATDCRLSNLYVCPRRQRGQRGGRGVQDAKEVA